MASPRKVAAPFLPLGLGLSVCAVVGRQVMQRTYDVDIAPHILLGLCVTTLLLVWTSRAPKLKVPGPTWYPIIGSTYEFVQKWDKLQSWIHENNGRYGYKTWGISIVRNELFPNGALVSTTPATTKYILKDNFENYIKGPCFYDILESFLGQGIFASDGARWRVHRKVATKMFSNSLLREGTGVAKTQALKLLEKVEHCAKLNEAFDLQSCFYAFTMDTFCYIAFGIDLDSQNTAHPFARAFDAVQQISDNRMANPFWKLRRLLRYAEERELTQGVREMTAFAREIIASRRREQKEGGKLGPDLISRFLDDAAKKGEPEPTDKELIDIILNFLIAGRDTTACALSWIIFELCRHPEVVDAILAEVYKQLPDAAPGTLAELPPTVLFDVCHGMLPYTRAVVSETLRLHPSVPKDVKYAVSDDVLPDGTAVMAGVAIVYCPYAMGRDPNIWKDPLKFDPFRWLIDSTKNAKDLPAGKESNGNDRKPAKKVSLHRPTNRSDFEYPVFNAGPRLCLGRPLAYLEIQLMLVLLLDKFSIEIVGPISEEYKQSLVAPLKNGLTIKARLRRS